MSCGECDHVVVVSSVGATGFEMTARDDFTVALGSDRAVLVVRCGGAGGQCGKAGLVMLADGTVQHAPVRCHNFDDLCYERDEVRDAFRSARVAWVRARRQRRRFRPVSVVVVPLARHRRLDRDMVEERDWAAFEASGERRVEEELDEPSADEDVVLGGDSMDWLDDVSEDWA